MIGKWLRLIGKGPHSAAPPPPFGGEAAASGIYNLLFCDDLAAFAPRSPGKMAPWQETLFGPEQDARKVSALASEPTAESRVRALAYTWLRGRGKEVPKGIVLGVVIERPIESGIDVVAAYADGGARYINHTGRMSFFEPGAFADVDTEAKRLVELGALVAARIGPTDKPRQPPPPLTDIRITFVVSDGLYVGQGPIAAIENDAYGGPLMAQGGKLLSILVERALATPTA